MEIGKIADWMKYEIEYYRDPRTGEVNLTELAEAAYDHFGGYEAEDDIDEYFDLAFEIAEKLDAL